MLRIMKFGGTSVDTFEHRCYAIGKIQQELDQNHQVVAVISAMGRQNDPYSTASLLSFSQFLEPRQKDRLLAQGEILSSLVFENQCRQAGIRAHACTPTEIGILTDDSYQNAQVLQLNPSWIRYYLKDHEVVLVPGFIGLNSKGHLTTLGRGGSDQTAILMAEALQLKEVTIYTDVDGIYEEDPKKNAQAKRFTTLDYEACLELVLAGAKVMMPESVKLAQKRQIAFTVASTFKNQAGTKVVAKKEEN